MMNETTKQLLEGLLKLKEVKPKIRSITADYDVFAGYYLSDKTEATLTLDFVGYIGSLYALKPKDSFISCSFPVEVNFSISYISLEDFNSIDWDAINATMGYVVGQPLTHESWSLNKITNPYTKKPESHKACTCDKFTVCNYGCKCGGS